MLKVPESKIRVVAGDIGGSFGMKSAVYNEVALVLLGSKLTGRPVKWTSTRSEAFVSDAQARDNITDAELALDREGHFLGFRVKTIANLGAYLQMNSNVFVGNLGTLAGVYRTPAIHADVTAVFTHTNPVRPYRGNGRPEAAYVIERIVDCAAKELGIDPLELRRRNIIPPEAMPFKSGLTFTYDCGEFATTLSKAERAADFAGFPARRAAAKKRGKLRGLGLSNTIERAAAPGFEAAEVRFDSSGTATLLSGSITQGQGHETIYKQIICDRLGLKPEQVHYVQGDTDKVAIGQGTGGSRSATLGGSAVLAASDKIIAKGRAIAAKVGHRRRRCEIRGRRVLLDALQPHTDYRRDREGIAQPAQPARRAGARSRRQRDVHGEGREFPQRLPRLRAGNRRGDRHRRHHAL